MPKQFLLNPDGSIPQGVDIEILKSENIPLVLPTTRPRQAGMIAVEQNPEQDENGVWRQVWILIPAPETEPEQSVIDPLSHLTEEQKLALIELLKTKQ